MRVPARLRLTSRPTFGSPRTATTRSAGILVIRDPLAGIPATSATASMSRTSTIRPTRWLRRPTFWWNPPTRPAPDAAHVEVWPSVARLDVQAVTRGSDVARRLRRLALLRLLAHAWHMEMLRAPRILVVDDEPPLVELVRGYLGREGFEVLTACDGPVSYTHLRAHETDSYLVCRLMLDKKKSI